jgi:LPPG:FO 2-phospho-L-lactate transferase
LPVSDDPVVTRVGTRERGELHFEEYLVKHEAALTVDYVRYVGADAARPAPGVLESIRNAECVVVAPSNPIVSIGPILAVQGIRAALRETPAPVVGVSPLIRGRAVKGPADRMMAQLGYDATALGVASLYRDFLDGLVIDERDAGLEESVAGLGLAVHVTDTLMDSVGAAARLAQEVLDFARCCQPS